MSLSPRERQHYWQQHIDEWQSSELSGTQYCQAHQLTYHCFIYWRRKLASQDDVARHHDPLPSGNHRPGAFVAVQAAHQVQPVSEVSPVADSLQLALPNGLVIQNIADSNLSTVRALLAYL